MWSLAFRPDGSQLATGASDGKVRIYSLEGLAESSTGLPEAYRFLEPVSELDSALLRLRSTSVMKKVVTYSSS